MKGYIPLILKDSVTHLHFLAVYVNAGLLFVLELSLENSKHSYLYWTLLNSVFYEV